MRKFEPKHRLVRNGMEVKVERSRKAMKEAKNKGLKVRGTGASVAKHKAKRAEMSERQEYDKMQGEHIKLLGEKE